MVVQAELQAYTTRAAPPQSSYAEYGAGTVASTTSTSTSTYSSSSPGTAGGTVATTNGGGSPRRESVRRESLARSTPLRLPNTAAVSRLMELGFDRDKV